MIRRLMRAGHDCVVFDANPAAVAAISGERSRAAPSLDDRIGSLPRTLGLMLPAGVVDPTIERMAPLAALDGRFASPGAQDFANPLLSALRDQFGGHEERPA